MVEELTIDEPLQQQQQDPIPKKRVLYDAVSKKYNLGTYEEFESKLKDPTKRKSLYDHIGKEFELGTYQDFESKLSLDEKKNLGGNALPTTSKGTNYVSETPSLEQEPIPIVTDYGDGELVMDNPVSKAVKAFKEQGKTKEVEGLGDRGTVRVVPDEKAQKISDDITADLEKQGFKADFRLGIQGLPEDAFNAPETSRETLVEVYKENPLRFKQLTNEAKTKYAVRNAAFENANRDIPEGEDKDYLARQTAIIESNAYSGDDVAPLETMNDLRNVIANKQGSINRNISDEDTKRKLQETLRDTYQSYINPESLNLKEEYDNSDVKNIVDINQFAGLETLRLFDPAKYENYKKIIQQKITPLYSAEVNVSPEEKIRVNTSDSLFASKNKGVLSPLTISETIGQETVLRELNAIGIGNEAEQLYSLRNDLVAASKNVTSTEELNNIKQRYNEVEMKINNLSKQEKLDDERYPTTAQLKYDAQVKEALEDKGISVGGFMYNKYAHGLGSSVDAVESLVTSLFGSDEDKTKLSMKRMGETQKFDASVYLPENERRLNSDVILQIPDELKKQANKILNGRKLKDLSSEERQQLNDLMAKNQDKVQTITNPEAGKSKNFWSKATVMTVAGFTSEIAAFMTKMALLRGVGVGSKVAEAEVLFMDGYNHSFNQKLSEGASASEANEYGVLHGAILATMVKFGSKFEAVKKIMAGGKSPLSKQIAGMSEEIWNQIYSNNKSFIQRLGSSAKNVAKEQVKMIGTFAGIAPTADALADNAFYNADISGEQIIDNVVEGSIDMAIGGLPLIGFGLVKGSMKSKATPLDKAALWNLGDNPEIGKLKIDEAVTKGDLTLTEGEIRKKTIDDVSKLITKVPTETDNGKLMTDQQRMDYLFNLTVQENAKQEAKDLPPKQAEKADHKAKVAEYENQIILSTPTEKQLNDRIGVLERKLEPKKDAEGKAIELPEKEKLDLQAELEATKNAIEQNKNNVVVEPPKEVPESIPLKTKEDIAQDNGIVVEPPKQVAEVVELNAEPPKNNYTEMYNEVLNDPAKREQALKEISDQWHDPRSRKLIEESIAPEIIEEAKQKFPQNEEAQVTKDTNATAETLTEQPMVDETTQPTGGKKEPPKEPTDTVGEGEDIGGITHAANEVRRQQRNQPEYQKNPTTEERLMNEAEQKIKDGYDIDGLMNQMEKGYTPEPVENFIRKIYIATLDAEIAKNPTDALLAKQKRFVELGDKANSTIGLNLWSLKGQGSPLTTISDFYVAKMQATGEMLTEAQKAEVKKQYEDVQKTNEEAKLKIQKLEEENAKLRAEAEIKKAKSTTKKEKKDFAKEREDIKKNILDKWNKSKNVGFTPDPSKDLLMDIAPDVAKLVKSYIQEGVVKLEELVTKIHEELKGYIPIITEKNVNDIIAGQYDKPKETKGDLLSKLRGIKDKKSEEAVKIKARIKAGDFATPKKVVSWVDNPEIKKNFPKEYNAALDAIKAKEDARHEFDIALLRDQMARRTLSEKATDALSKTAGTIKAITTGIDDSAVAIQTYVSMLVRPRTGVKAFYQHIRQGASQNKFDRWLSALHSSPDFKEMREMGLDITEPSSLKEREKEEIFNNRFSGTIRIKGKDYKLLDAPLKPFERAFTTLGNVTRVVGYRTMADKYKQEGYTIEKNPELFKSLAKRLNTETGRGDVNEYVEMANKVVTMGIWSPKLMAQKFNILGISDLASLLLSKHGTKGYYRQLHPKERLAAIGDVAHFATAVMALSYGFALAFGGKVDDDPLSSTYMDVKLDNGKSYNFTGGFSGYIRAISQFVMGQKNKDGKSKDVNRLETAGRFFRGKTPPLTSGALDLAAGKNFMGQPTDPLTEVTDLAPISLKGIAAQIQNDGATSLFSQGIPTFFGFGVKNEKDYEKSDYTSDELKDPTLKYYADKKINFPELSPEKIITKEVNNKPTEKLSDYDQKTQDDYIKAKKKYLKEGLQELKDGYVTIYKDEDGGVSIPSENEDLTDKTEVAFKDLTQEQLQYLVSQVSRKATIKTKEEIDLKSRKKKAQ